MYVPLTLFKYGQKRGDEMSPRTGRPTQEKRDKRFEIRLSESTYNILEECSNKLKISKAAVIHKGIALVKSEIDKK